MAGTDLCRWAVLAVLTAGYLHPARAEPPASGVTGPGVAYSGGPNASLLVVSRPNEQRLRYRIDGYVLELTADDGAVERHFIARFGDDKADDPHSPYIGGEMLWDRDKDDKPAKKQTAEPPLSRRWRAALSASQRAGEPALTFARALSSPISAAFWYHLRA